ncbi:AraC-like ligand binding domain-containing protein [Chitinophaga niabensis]|uniref:AraC-like ligand binding domain-containing protein n=2 Tax=Chitinophaga niabensis TaxID=536979 RepID=A0A1N6DVT2_9BACT|nr:AraC-like ligand binding domain-containing protein [Chitinophaga niabensis]
MVALYQLAESGNTYLPPSHNLPLSYTEQIRIAEPAHFSVFRLDEYPGNQAYEANRSDLYKIMLLTKGRSQFHYHEQPFHAVADCLLFLKPVEITSWKNTTAEQEGYYCIFNPSFFAFNAMHLKTLQDNMLFNDPVLRLGPAQAAIFRDLFIKLHQEFNNILQYNTEMLRLYLHIMLIEAGRAYDHQAAQLKASSEAARMAERFQQLLEEEVAKVMQGQVLRMKTVKQLADQLAVHPAYLNTCVKSITGKTPGEFIKSRLRHEALQSQAVH